jgi:hypothetical protein
MINKRTIVEELYLQANGNMSVNLYTFNGVLRANISGKCENVTFDPENLDFLIKCLQDIKLLSMTYEELEKENISIDVVKKALENN